MTRRQPAAAVFAAMIFAALLVVAASISIDPAAADAQEQMPTISAPAAIVVEPATRTVVYQRNANQRRPIASTTKMMTALVTIDNAALNDTMRTVAYAGAAVESIGGFGADERVSVRDLLGALMVTSANDAAMTLAVRIGGSERGFVRMMNERARRMGLRDTHFDNPIGLDGEGNYSTASDLVKIALELRRDPFLRRLVDRRSVRLTTGARPRTFVNSNTLLRSVPYVNGVKTGHTERAGYLLVGSATRDGVTVVSAVIAARSEAARNRDTFALLRYALGRFKVATAVQKGQRLASARLAFRGDSRTSMVADRTVRRTIGKSNALTVSTAGVPTVIDGPLAAGARVGTVVVRDRDGVIERIPLVTAQAIDAATFADRLRTWIAKPLTLTLLGIFVVCSVYLLRVRLRARRREPSVAQLERDGGSSDL